MPICPKCFSTIHHSAAACPGCGYSLAVAEQKFTAEKVRFSRVHDVAGALCNRDRAELVRFLEASERRLPPVVPCVYITDCGEKRSFSTLAHWILNHAEIDDNSFGLRQRPKLLSEVSVRMGTPGEAREEDESETGNAVQRMLRRVKAAFLDWRHPIPPPVDQRWFLMLVLDVQLNAACFSWGYMLDPYVEPMRINSAILGGMLQFRERSMLAALKRVMEEAVTQIAVRSHAVNRDLAKRRGGVLPGVLLCSALLTLPALSPAVAAPTAPAPSTAAAGEDAIAEEVPEATEDDAVAEEVTDTPTAPQTPAPVPNGNAAHLPRWTPTDYSMLMDGRLADSFAALFPEQPAQQSAKKQEPRRPKPSRRNASAEQGDLLRLYIDHFRRRTKNSSDLCDPAGLLSAPEADDVDYLLRNTNASSSFRIYVVLVQGAESIPTELSAPAITHALVPTFEHGVVIRYTPGTPDSIDLGYCNIPGDEAQRDARRNAVRLAATKAGDRVEGILAAVRSIHAQLLPMSGQFITPKDCTGALPPRIDIPMRPVDKPEKKSISQKIEALLAIPGVSHALTAGAVLLTALALAYLFYRNHRHSGRLRETKPDLRLGSPYGAGVSRCVSYMTGHVAKSTPSL